MTFNELMVQVVASSGGRLPRTAIRALPKQLSLKTQQMILRSSLSPEELSDIIFNAVIKINNGSLETMDSIISKSLRKAKK